MYKVECTIVRSRKFKHGGWAIQQLAMFLYHCLHATYSMIVTTGYLPTV